MNINKTLQLLDIQEVTTSRQNKNGTREFKLPVKDQYGAQIHVASFASGYVRRTKAGGYCPSWQINKTKKSKRYVNMNNESNSRPVIRTFDSITRILIPNEQDRLEYLIGFCLKNYYIGQANMLSNGKFVPKWKYEADKSEQFAKGFGHANEIQELKVIVNGNKYNVI